MLSRIIARSLAGTISRITSSTWPKTRSVSSMRVPDGARTCSRNWPASTAGKKSWPSHGAKRQRADGEAEHQRERENGDGQRPAEQALVGRAQALEQSR